MIEHLCVTCDRAKWKLTAGGAKHPDGSGRCDWTPEHIPTPAAWHWGGWADRLRRQPLPEYGYITRKPKGYKKPITACELYRKKQ